MSTHHTYLERLNELAGRLDEPVYDLLVEMQEELESLRAQMDQIRKSGGLQNEGLTARRKVESKRTNSIPIEGLHPDWLTSAQVQTSMGISKRTLQNYRDQGVIAFSKLKGKIYYSRKNIEALITPRYQKLDKAETLNAAKNAINLSST